MSPHPRLTTPAVTEHASSPVTRDGAVAPVVVTDAPAMAHVLAAALGMTSRQLRDLVDERSIRHTKWKRHIFVVVGDVLSALGLGGVPAATSPEPESSFDEDAIIALAARPKGGVR